MIYNYTYIKHNICKAQSFVNYIVLEILCKASKPNMPAVFDENAVIDKYKGVVRDINTAYIKNPINSAYQICRDPDNHNLVKLLKKALHSNIDIKSLCENKFSPVLYSEIKAINKTLANDLYVFNKNLYTEVFKLKPFTDLFGNLKDHYKDFSIANGFKNKRCPFCGSTRMENEYNSKKEAYDHFFPKEQYPFTSIHFLNLAPMCYKCNSLYKGRKNPIDIHKTGSFKRVFFVYNNDYERIDFRVDVNTVRIDNLTPLDISITNTLNNFDDEVSSWEELFNIPDRHRGIYVGDGFTWFEETRIATDNFGLTYNDYKVRLGDNYFTNENFMKLAFLEACERQGLTD